MPCERLTNRRADALGVPHTHTHTQKRREKIKKQLKKNEPIKRITFYFFSKADAILRALSCRSSSFVLVVFVCFFMKFGSTFVFHF